MLNCRIIQIRKTLLILLMLLNLIFRIQSNPLLTEINSDDIYNDLRHLGGSCSIVDGCKETRNTGLLRFLNCHCDSSCVELDTCCLDSQFRPLEHQLPRPDLKCFSGYYGAFHVFLVDSCRRDWIDDGVIARMCLSNGKDADDPFLDMPMTSLKTGISYKNYFCSICNENIVDEDQMAAWDILIKERRDLVTSSTGEYISNVDKSADQMSTSKLATTPTWPDTTYTILSRTELVTSDFNTSPTVKDTSDFNISPTVKGASDFNISPTVKDTGDILDDPYTRQTTNLVTNPTIGHIYLRPTVQGISTINTNSSGQDKYSLETILSDRNTSSMVSEPSLRIRNRVTRSSTSESDPVAHPTMPELKYNASLQTWMAQLQNSSTIPVTIKITVSSNAWNVVKTCHPGLISECSMDWTEASTARKCSSYMLLTRIERNGTTFRYRNPHCAICNHESLENADCSEETRSFGMGGSSDLYEAFFVGLFVLEDRKKKCGKDMVYDSLFKKCRVVNCPPHHTFKDSKCVKDDS